MLFIRKRETGRKRELNKFKNNNSALSGCCPEEMVELLFPPIY